MFDLETGIREMLGIVNNDLMWWQMLIRATIVYIAALLMVRLGDKRFFGKSTAFDVILGIVFGSVVSRAITGSAPFFPTLVAGFTLVMLHWVLATAAFHSDWFGDVVKGHSRILVKDGEILWDEMRRSNISHKDLLRELRLRSQTQNLDQVRIAQLERSGDISVIPSRNSPQVLEIRVENGVQIVRIQIE